MSIPEPILVNGLDEHVGHVALDMVLPRLQEVSPYKEMIAKMQANTKRARADRLLMFQYFMDEWVEGKIEVEGVVSWKDFRQNVAYRFKKYSRKDSFRRDECGFYLRWND